jgi:DNA anti-recombination protein RmuC
MQTELTSFAKSLDRTGNNLLQFNSDVENNLREAKNTLSEINVSYRELHATVKAIKQLKIDELSEYESRKKIINRAANTINTTITDVVNTLNNNSQQQLVTTKKTAGIIDDTMSEIVEKMREHTETQLSEFTRAVVTNKEQLLKKLEEETILADELRNLTEIKTGIAAFETATQEQNQKLDNLCAVIEQFIEIQGGKKGDKSFLSKLTGK